MSPKIDVNSLFDKVLPMVKKSAEIMLDGFYNKKHVSTKTTDWDLVTEFDKKVEASLVDQLLKEFPDHKIIAEEGHSGTELSNDPTWIIDPIDGTTNFVHAFPQSCISVAFTVNKEIVIGSVYNPVTDQFFTAKKGQGAFLNGKSIKVSKTEAVSQSLLALEMLRGRQPGDHEHLVKTFGACLSNAQGVKVVGSAALSLCYVAMGSLDAYYASHYLSSYDIAAGVLIVKEAGGFVISTSGGQLDLMAPKIIAASTSALAKNLVQLLKEP